LVYTAGGRETVFAHRIIPNVRPPDELKKTPDNSKSAHSAST